MLKDKIAEVTSDYETKLSHYEAELDRTRKETAALIFEKAKSVKSEMTSSFKHVSYLF